MCKSTNLHGHFLVLPDRLDQLLLRDGAPLPRCLHQEPEGLAGPFGGQGLRPEVSLLEGDQALEL